MVLHQMVKQSLSMLQPATANIILVILQLSLILTFQVMNYEYAGGLKLIEIH